MEEADPESNRESVVDIEGIVSLPDHPIEGTTTQQAGRQFPRIDLETRLKYRVLDLRTPANQGIFSVVSQVDDIFTKHLRSEGFVGFHPPTLIPGSNEMGGTAYLSQSPQIFMQMYVSGGVFSRVYGTGPVLRAKDSNTPTHLYELTGLGAEMEIKENYFEVMDTVDSLFVEIFDGLNLNCKKELEAIGKQFPFEPLKYLQKTLRLTFQQGVQMLKEAGIEVDHLCDLNTEAERKLGELVLQEYDTDFYILHRYPLAVRPSFYTTPYIEDPKYGNSFCVFIRGEEIISGAVHDPEFLKPRAKECGIDFQTISTYFDGFRIDAPPRPHGGFVLELERVVMLFCALKDIRMTILFPRAHMVDLC